MPKIAMIQANSSCGSLDMTDNSAENACSGPVRAAPAWREGTIDNGVLIGRRGQLFLAGGAHAVLGYVTGEMDVPSQSYANFNSNVIQRAAWSKARAARYLHVIFPDKQSVLVDDYPLAPPICLGDKYLDSAGQAQADILYLKEDLRQGPDGAFLRTDTHLSDSGLARAADAIARRFTDISMSEMTGKLRQAPSETRDHCGDLGSKLQPRMTAPEAFLTANWPLRYYTNNVSRNNGMVDIWFSPATEGGHRLLIFGDSFGRGMARFLSSSFREVLFLRTQYFHLDIVDQMRPTHIITETVERYLTFIEPDRNRPSFHMYPFLGASEGTVPGREFAEAFSAMLSYPRPPYQRFVANIQQNHRPASAPT